MSLLDPSAIRTTELKIDKYASSDKETDVLEYTPDFSKWLGLYKDHPELRSTIDVWCKWIIGKKIKFKNKEHEKQAKRITGNGKDTIRTILLNILRVSKNGGDGFGEITRDKAGRTINIIPRNPETITIIGNKKARILGYMKADNKFEEGKELDWKPDEMFHIMNSRIADEIHGIPEAEKLMQIINWKKQLMEDTSEINHRYGRPTYFYETSTDDATEMADIEEKINKAVKEFKNVLVPKGVLNKIERVTVPQYSTIDPMPFMIFLRSYFTESSNVPDLIRGKSDEVSLAAGKLNYLGFKEKIIMEQLEFAEQIEMQLGWEIEFEEPAEIDLEIARTEAQQRGKITAKQDKKITTGKEPENIAPNIENG